MQTPLPHNIKEACQNASYANALTQLVEGASKDSVVEDLVNEGLSKDEAICVVEQSTRLFNEAKRNVGSSEIYGGISFVVLGIAASVATYLMAVENGGGIFIVWHGAVLYGGISIARGVRLRKTNIRGIVRNQIYSAKEAAQAGQGEQHPQKNTKNRGQYDY